MGEKRSRTTYSLGTDTYGMKGQSVCGDARSWGDGGILGTSATVTIDRFGLSSCCGQKPQEITWETGTEWSVSPHSDNPVSITWETGTEWSVSVGGDSPVSITWETGTEWSVSVGGDSPVSITWETGTEWSVSEEEMIPGMIIPYGGSSAPSGYLLCDGASVLRSTYAALFSVIGTAFGSVDGTHFNVPDMQRRVPMGAGGTQVSPPATSVGEHGGSETHTLTLPETPAHTHPAPAPATGFYGFAAGVVLAAGANYTANAGFPNTGSAGGGGAHNNVQPSLVVNFIIKT